MVHKALARLAKAGCFSAVVSTNYDDLLERAFADEGVPVLLQVREDNKHVLEQGAIRLLKPHGDRSNLKETVLSGESYRTFSKDTPGVVEQLDELLKKYPVFFVGYSMTDPRTLDWLRDLGEGGRRDLKRWRPLMTDSSWKDAVVAGGEAMAFPPTKALILENYDEHLPSLLDDVAEHFDPPTGDELELTITAGAEEWRAEIPGCEPWTFKDPIPEGSELAKKLEKLRELDHKPLPLDDSGHLAGGAAKVASALRELATEIGDALVEICFSDAAGDLLAKGVAGGLEGQPCLLRVRVCSEDGSDAANLRADHALALPWELLRVAERFPVEELQLDIVREVVVPELEGLQEPTDPLRVVATVAAPDDATALDYEGEVYRLWQALGADESRWHLTDRGTLDEFVSAIRDVSPPVAHFTGHGAPGVLLFENDLAYSHAVPTSELTRDLRANKKALPRLLYLACCHGATLGGGGEHTPGTRAPKFDEAATKLTSPSTAATLHRAGFPQVVAYFGPVGDEQSTRIEAYFYRGLARGESAREALRLARKWSAKPHEERSGNPGYVYPLGWAQTVLYHRGEDVATALASSERELAADLHWKSRKRSVERIGSAEDDRGVVRLSFGFVGRRTTRAKLLRRWSEGERFTLVAGLGGLGKTALCAEALPTLALYVGRDRDAGRDPGQVPVMALDARVAKDEEDPVPRLWQEVQAFSPDGFDETAWQSVLAGLQENGITGQALAQAIYEAAKMVGGLVLYVDDAESLQVDVGEGDVSEWRSVGVAEFWSHLASLVEHGRTEGVPFGVLASTRYVPTGASNVMHLDPMREADLVRLLRWFPTLARLPHENVTWLAGRANGHPRTVEFLEGIVTRALERWLEENEGPNTSPADVDWERLNLDWRKAVLEPGLEGLQQRLDENLLLPRLWESLTDEEQEHLGRCLAILSPVPIGAVNALGSAETQRSLIGLGLISPAPAADPKSTWWAPHRLVADAVSELWDGDIQDAHRTLGRHFASLVRSDGKVAMVDVMFAVEQLIAAKELEEAWPLTNGLGQFLYAEGRYREALGWVDKLLSSGPQGATRALAFCRRADYSIAAGASLDGVEEELQAALGFVDENVKMHVYIDLGRLLRRLGRLKEAATHEREGLNFALQTFGEEHPGTLTLMGHLASTLDAQGDLAGARELGEQVLAVRRRTLGDEHPHTLIAMNNLASMLDAQGDLAGARELGEQVLAVQRRTLGDEHPHTLTSMGNLASTLEAQGDLAGCARARGAGARGPTTDARGRAPQTLTSMNNLASTLDAQGDLAGARELGEQVLAVRRRTLGDEHPQTLTSMNNLAQMLDAQGDLAGARELGEQALAVRRRTLGDEHPQTLTSMGNLASTLYEQGDLAGARELEEQVLAVQRRTLGDEHPHTLTSMSNLAQMLQAQGDLAGARELGEQVLAVRRRTLGDEHPHTLIAMNNLASMHYAQGDLAGARELGEQVLAVQRRTLGDEHPQTLTSMNNLAQMLQAQDDLAGARELFQEMIEIVERAAGPDHPLIEQLREAQAKLDGE